MPKPVTRFLSQELTGPKDFEWCQSCGRHMDDPANKSDYHRWMEHDENDKENGIVIMLCHECADKIIEKHPALYREMHDYEPHPGSIANLCRDCAYREGFKCKHPFLMANGGPGLEIRFPKPTVAFIDGVTGPKGGRRVGWREKVWHGWPTSCSGRNERNPLRVVKKEDQF